MKLIDRLMRDICSVMGWQYPNSIRTDMLDIRAKLTPVAEQHDRESAAKDAVVDAAREAVASHAKTNITPTGPMREALAALDEAVCDD